MEGEQETFLSCQYLVQIGCREIAGSAKRNDIVEYFQVVDIFRSEQGAATGAGGRHQDLVFLEVRMFSTTLIPLSSVRTVAPNSGSVFISLIFPGAGSSGISGSLETVSS